MCELICEENFGYNHNLNIWLIKNFSTSFSARILPQISFLRLRNLPLMHFLKMLKSTNIFLTLIFITLSLRKPPPSLQKQDIRVQGSYFSGLSRGKGCSCRRPKNIKVDYLRSRGVFDGFCQRKLFYKNITFSENLWTFWIWSLYGYEVSCVAMAHNVRYYFTFK